MSMQILLPLALFAAAPRQASTSATTERENTEIVKRAQTLFDALAPGDIAVWREALTEDAVLIDELGRRQTKAEALRDMRPLPPGFSGSIEIRQTEGALLPSDSDSRLRDVRAGEGLRAGAHRPVSRDPRVRAPGPRLEAGGDGDSETADAPPRLEVRDLPLADYPGTYTYGPGRNFIVEVEGRELKLRTRSDGRDIPRTTREGRLHGRWGGA
jgi:hypothetical protein